MLVAVVREGAEQRRRRLPAGLRTDRRRGQVLVIVALMFTVLVGFAGLALDAGHLFLVAHNAQNAADTAALSAGKQLTGGLKTSPPADSNDPAVKAAHDLAASNGFTTIRNTTCDTATPTSFQTSWYDTPLACGATNFTTRVAIYSPPQTLTADCQAVPYNCLQVVVTQQVQNFLMGVLGIPTTTISSTATVFAEPAGSVLPGPAGIGLYLYQPQAGCGGIGKQCFNEAAAPARSQLSCSGLNNCPTLWIRPGSGGVIQGINGSLGAGDLPALESAGDIVIQDPTTVCDPFGGAACSAGSATGAKGFSLAAGSKLYCSGSTPASESPVACSAAGPGGVALSTVAGNETAFTTYPWSAQVDTSALPACGHLVLNGDKVTVGNVIPPACTPAATDPYTIMPGKYDWIAINHGNYQFAPGIYDILGSATVNTNISGSANGIDHSGEAAADFDLCTGAAGSPTACPLLSAGVWIGHATSSLLIGAGAASTPGACDDSGPPPVQGGGGDATQIGGSGVVFKLEPSAGGFVSTNEVDFIELTAPAPGAMRQTAGVPILFDAEGNQFIHLDASGANPTFMSQFAGVLFQNSGVNGGGVEVDPHLGNGQVAAIKGQVFAYSFTTFGAAGGVGILNFSAGLGASTSPLVSTAGDDEQEILTGANLVDPGVPGFERLVVTYNDEWKLDAYNVYVKINNNAPVFFSAGIWNPAPAPGAPLPPASNNPGDAFPAAPAPAQDPSNNYVKVSATDWKITYGPAFSYGPGDNSTFEVSGAWVWGHEEDIPGSVDGANDATVTYTFPIPSGPVVNAQIFMSDGDSCGDFAIATFTFNNLAGGGGGGGATQSVGTVHLVQ